jgi:hypothetical protein
MRRLATQPRFLLPMGCLVFAAGYLLSMRVHPWANEQISDIRLFIGVAYGIQHGLLPYRDFVFGYPPLAAVVMWLGGVGGTSYAAYRDTFMWLMLPFGLSLVPLTWIVARRTKANELIAVGAVAVTPLLLGAMLRTHFDLVPVALTMAALALILTERPRLGFAVLAVAIAVKGYPIVVAAVAIPWLWKAAGRRTCIQATLIMAAVVAVPLVAGLALSGHGALHSLTDQTGRPVEIEGTGASILFTLGHLGFSYPQVTKAAGSWGLAAPESGAVSALLDLLGVIAIVAIVALVWKRPDPRRLALGSLAAVVVFVTTGKVLSPQYLIWMIPLFALAAAWGQRALAASVGAAMILTFAMFPSHFHDVVFQRTPWLVEVGVRNLLLVTAVLLALRELATARDAVSVAQPAQGRTPALAHAG